MMDENLKIGILEEKDFEKLSDYLNNLSASTRSRFAPHGFDLATIQQFYLSENKNVGFIVENMTTGKIIAYAVVKRGYVLKDQLRIEDYGLPLFPETDCTFAPSVADAWQSIGLGNRLFGYIKKELQIQSVKRIILWGGVQARNEKAVNFYVKQGFKKIGNFERNGIDNFDMMLKL